MLKMNHAERKNDERSAPRHSRFTHFIGFSMALRGIAVALILFSSLQVYLGTKYSQRGGNENHTHGTGASLHDTIRSEPPHHPDRKSSNDSNHFKNSTAATGNLRQHPISSQSSIHEGMASKPIVLEHVDKHDRIFVANRQDPSALSIDNYNVDWRQSSHDKSAVKLLVTQKELGFMQQRQSRFESWFNASLMNETSKRQIQPHYSSKLDFFEYNADWEGPWLDFVIAGFPKCGTTTLMATLGQLAPMPIKDVCDLPPTLLKMVHRLAEALWECR
jgi:hypothetical protein